MALLANGFQKKGVDGAAPDISVFVFVCFFFLFTAFKPAFAKCSFIHMLYTTVLSSPNPRCIHDMKQL